MFVFRGIREDRPYPVTGLTTARWVNEVKISQVNVADLWLTQRHLDIDALLSPCTPYGGDLVPHVVQHDDDMYLEDGHHRVIRAVLLGDLVVSARIFQVESMMITASGLQTDITVI